MDDDLEIDDKMRHTFEKVCKRIFVRNENRPHHSKKIPTKNPIFGFLSDPNSDFLS